MCALTQSTTGTVRDMWCVFRVQVRFYNNVYEVLRNGAERLIQPWQSRKQVMVRQLDSSNKLVAKLSTLQVMEECHRQNPLPRKIQSLKPKLNLNIELESVAEEVRARI